MKTSPGNIQLRRTAGGQTDPGARHGSGLSGTGEGVKAVQRHIPFDCACDALVACNGSTPLRISLRIPSEIRSSAWAGLLSRVLFAGSCGSTAVETQGRIALLENAVALQCARSLRQIEAAAVLRDHHAAGREEIPRTQRF